MNKHACHPQLLTSEECAPDGVPAKETATVLTAGAASQLDVCRCPKCEAPMTARNGANGPYFHCLCVTKPKKGREKADEGRQTSEPEREPITCYAVASLLNDGE